MVALVAVLVAGLATVAGAQRAHAANLQATPVASGTPVATACSGPALVAAPNAGTPEAEVATPLPATPATPAAMPPVDEPTRSDIEATALSLAACLTEGNAQAVSSLVTERYLGDAYGGGERMTKSDYLVIAQSAAVVPVQIRSISDLTFSGPESATAVVESVQGNQLRNEQWTFLFRRDRQPLGTPVDATSAGMGRWLVHGLRPLEVSAPAGASTVEATLDDYTISLSAQQATGPDLAIRATNEGAEAHEILVLRLNAGTTTDQLLRPASETFPAGIDVVGQVTVPVGESRDLVLVDLPAGAYTIVCLLPDASGIPHLAHGQQATLTVR